MAVQLLQGGQHDGYTKLRFGRSFIITVEIWEAGMAAIRAKRVGLFVVDRVVQCPPFAIAHFGFFAINTHQFDFAHCTLLSGLFLYLEK